MEDATMSTGLVLIFLFYALLLLVLVGVAVLLPASLLGRPAKAVLHWLPPFLGGKALRDWAANTAEQQAQRRLSEPRTAATASQIATELEQAAMEAMIPLGTPPDWNRVVACPDVGQGRISVSAPEALALAAHLRRTKSRAEQQRIFEAAVRN